MIYKFKSKGAGDVIMLGPTGDQLLRLLGREPAAKGIIEVADMPAVIATLERAVADDEAARAQAEAEAQAEGRKPGPRDSVTLRQRVWPLVEMLRRSHAGGHDIVWGV
jgi:regulator of protease activity HflC (stomatin/prohibitin superfamily)